MNDAIPADTGFYTMRQKLLDKGVNELQAATLAKAHDRGKWLNKASKELHLGKRLKYMVVTDGIDYKQKINEILGKPDADVYLSVGKKNIQRYIIRDEETKWTVYVDKNGLIRTALRQTLTNKRRSIFNNLGKLKDFIGDF
ncbi:MAG: hypothetical protein QME58_01730 [Bacteroidota bacterium]|nr:hypothetical protein [Bacteroidota bacterium]